MLGVFLSAPLANAASTFDDLVKNDALWTLDTAGFQAASKGLPLRWTSEAKDSARAAADGMTILGLPLVEFIARFRDGKVSDITANLYARGDAGSITQDQYNALIRKSVDEITKATGVKFIQRGKDASSAVKAEGVVWKTPKAEYTLEYSATREVKSQNIPFRAEFIRLEIKPAVAATGLLGAKVAVGTGGPTKFNGPANVKRDAATGDVMIANVPMVDQGEKGYCVVASMERVLRYYQKDVDTNELAQIANSSAEGGTSTEGMKDALKKISARLRIRVKEIIDWNYRDFVSMVRDYNRAAKKAGKAETPDPERIVSLEQIYTVMDGAVLKESRAKDRAAFGKWQRTIQAEIDSGVPLLWTVRLGLLPEPKRLSQTGGGHMRLIIGYNTKTQEIIFSDSWGSGHEAKKLSMADAWTITNTLTTVEPF